MTVQQLRSIYQIKITLAGARPPIWRRVLVSSTISLADFHLVIQIAMGWTNSHLHQFIYNREMYGIPDDEFDFGLETKDERKFKIGQLLKQEKDSMIYEYDFGDGWEHKIVLEKILPFDKDARLPVCVKGKRACPPEDCGGIWGYEELLDTVQDAQHPEHEQMLEWLGGDFDSEKFEIKEVNELLVEYCR